MGDLEWSRGLCPWGSPVPLVLKPPTEPLRPGEASGVVACCLIFGMVLGGARGPPGNGGKDPGGIDPGGIDPGGSDPGGRDPGGGKDPGGFLLGSGRPWGRPLGVEVPRLVGGDENREGKPGLPRP